MDSPTFTHYVYRTPHGPLTIGATSQGISHAIFGDVRLPGKCVPSPLTSQAVSQILEYLAGKRTYFDVALTPCGSNFQLAVWQETARIPYGHTTTAQSIAQAINKPSSWRSVGVALKKNPLAILIPDHRVVDSRGRTLGANHESLVKHALLELEQRTLK